MNKYKDDLGGGSQSNQDQPTAKNVAYNPEKPACLQHGYGHWTKDCTDLQPVDQDKDPMTRQLEDWLDLLLNKVSWGDYQNEDGSWGRGVSNREELREYAIQLIAQHDTELIAEFEKNVIGEDEALGDAFHAERLEIGARNRLRDKQRKVIEQYQHKEKGEGDE